ncbi:methylenetetrahydrofolate reductase [NAD(P)H] [Desulforegula conservatrix]|uniref:methylenetetrahydrofolate reductase [NAD(P)H] n=1 Tax=Desulforegula conservatrix TaxID=153026 RepID=UPI00047F6258|nr:methylenetetrahydrofolate reductase [NAD(P)H] [Desulforegula conservatrix]
MLVKDILNANSLSFSFEFFPPKTDKGWGSLFETISDLEPLKPAYVSVTYGAGGSTRDRTHDLVTKIEKDTGITVVSHLTCVGSSKDEIMDILKKYDEAGISNILALRGDAPEGTQKWEQHPDGFRHASELVAFIKKHFPHMGVGVAGFPEGHPETPNRLKEIDYLKAKVDEGADYIVTQLFFDNRDFYDFCERCDIAGINIPIVAGIMPIVTKSGMDRMAELAAGAKFPASLIRGVQRAESDEYVEKFGIHWATEQVRDLIDNKVKGIHFYTLNKSLQTLKIYESLGLKGSKQQ